MWYYLGPIVSYAPKIHSAKLMHAEFALLPSQPLQLHRTTRRKARTSSAPGRQRKEQNQETEQLFKSSENPVAAVSSQSSIWDHLYWKRPITLVEDIITMGACLSIGGGTPLIPDIDGNEQDFHSRFIEDRVLGEGEFGVVNLVHDMKAPESENAMACKILRKGVVFKDGTIYTPLKPEVLQGEIAMLRVLGGDHYCMKLIAVYETSRTIHMVTEYCAGGEMMEYVSKQEEDLRTDDVSRIAFQLLDAINHCANHDIIHRDLKPENVMFQSPTPGSDLRIIDFGSGTNRAVEGIHTTFAGSAFYISPEMFQRTYTQKTDIWSIGVTLYVLVAGYPAEKLQKTFNILQQNERDVRELPNFPDDMPDSFVDMLDSLLIYRHKQRKTAAEMLDHEFVRFHQSAFSMEQIALEAQQDTESSPSKNRMSISIKGSVSRHTQIVDYQKYQRGLTTLLATLLDKKELGQLMSDLDARVNEKKEQSEDAWGMHLGIIPVNELKEMLEEKKHDQVIVMIDKLPFATNYSSYAYDIALLKDFVRDDGPREGGPRSRSVRLSGRKVPMKRQISAGGSFRNSFRGSIFKKKNKSGSLHKSGSLRGRRNSTS